MHPNAFPAQVPPAHMWSSPSSADGPNKHGTNRNLFLTAKRTFNLKGKFFLFGFPWLAGCSSLFLFQLMLQSSPQPVTVFLEVQKVVLCWRYKFFWKVSLGDDLAPNHLLLAPTACPLGVRTSSALAYSRLSEVLPKSMAHAFEPSERCANTGPSSPKLFLP